MNIFVLDKNPWLAARYHCDKHVVKMILETAQLLSTAHHMLNAERIKLVEGVWFLNGRRIYGPTHCHHPCAVWAREGIQNYLWLQDLGCALCAEYTYRYNRVHQTSAVIATLKTVPDDSVFASQTVMTPHIQCVPDDCKIRDNPVEAYRNYYRTHKRDIAKWKLGNIPEWF